MSRSESDDGVAGSQSIFRREVRALREPFRLGWHYRALRNAPRGARTVMVIPGFSASDTPMAPLRRYLASRGHDVSGWGLGTNRGDVDADLPAVVEQVAARVDAVDGEPITLVGWSLGGVFAREVARTRPELVAELVTLASPLRQYGRAARDPDAPLITQPITAFYSTRDAVVGDVGCADTWNPNVEMIEVDASHLGIILDPTVWLKIASTLATP